MAMFGETAEVVCARLGIALTEYQKHACRFLEARGQRFLYDFGYGNCEDKYEAIVGPPYEWVM